MEYNLTQPYLPYRTAEQLAAEIEGMDLLTRYAAIHQWGNFPNNAMIQEVMKRTNTPQRRSMPDLSDTRYNETWVHLYKAHLNSYTDSKYAQAENVLDKLAYNDGIGDDPECAPLTTIAEIVVPYYFAAKAPKEYCSKEPLTDTETDEFTFIYNDMMKFADGKPIIGAFAFVQDYVRRQMRADAEELFALQTRNYTTAIVMTGESVRNFFETLQRVTDTGDTIPQRNVVLLQGLAGVIIKSIRDGSYDDYYGVIIDAKELQDAVNIDPRRHENGRATEKKSEATERYWKALANEWAQTTMPDGRKPFILMWDIPGSASRFAFASPILAATERRYQAELTAYNEAWEEYRKNPESVKRPTLKKPRPYFAEKNFKASKGVEGRNVWASLTADRIYAHIESSGVTPDAQRNGNKNKRYKDPTRVTIAIRTPGNRLGTYKTIMEEVNGLTDVYLATKAANGGRNQFLRVWWNGTVKALKEAYYMEKYIDFHITDTPPTPSTLNTTRPEIWHRGKNPDFDLALIKAKGEPRKEGRLARPQTKRRKAAPQEDTTAHKETQKAQEDTTPQPTDEPIRAATGYPTGII